jgi:transmembrane sensor
MNSKPASTDTIDAAAAHWLAQRDRGLTPAEQDEYLRWLRAEPAHAAAMARQAAALERMMRLYEWQPSHTAEPNADLFAPPARRNAGWLWSTGLAAAAAFVVGLYLLPGRPTDPPAAPKSYLHVNDRLALPDGSRVELRDGSKVVVQYSESERRVLLTGGEAHFTVWKDAARPFVVVAGGVQVHAVGTAFAVRLGDSAVEVLVTEGRVKVDSVPGPANSPLDGNIPSLAAGERATVARAASPAAPPAAPAVVAVTPEEIKRELAWQAPRLQFDETPLADAVAEFNRLNREQLVFADAKLGALRIGGTFRPDNVDGFVRLLATTHQIVAERDGAGRTLLRAAR